MSNGKAMIIYATAGLIKKDVVYQVYKNERVFS